MSRSANRLEDLENGDATVVDSRDQQSKGKVDYGDSSWPLYSIYSKIAQEEDNKMVERCLRDTDGTLVFTGLFAATVGALLTISIQDLKPNSQDTSAFYLKNIYQVLGNPNASQVSTPSPLTSPPVFSPPRFAIWVNSLWFLSLLISLTSATLGTSIQHWAHRYITITQQTEHTPDQRARIHAFISSPPRVSYAWGDGESPLYLHLSLFLFFAGCAIYLFNINRTVFDAVVWWVAIFTAAYAFVSLVTIFYHEDLEYTPLSPLLLHSFLGISYVILQVCSYIRPLDDLCGCARRRYRRLSDRYSEGFLPGKWKIAKETVSKPSSKIDASVIERILLALDDDRASEEFLNTIPGFCNSKLVNVPLPFPVGMKLRQAMDGFLDRTFSSNSFPESVRSDRLINCLNAANAALEPSAVSRILDDISNGRWGWAQQSVEMGHSLRRWGHGKSDSISLNIRRIVACILARARGRDDRWTMLAKNEFGVPDHILQDYLAHGDSASLAILIYTTRQTVQTRRSQGGVLRSLSQFNIRDTLPALQNDFCALWNEIILEAKDEGADRTIPDILPEIRHLFEALHQGTDVAPTAPFTASVDNLDSTLYQQSSYPLCNATSHRTDPTVHFPVPVIPYPQTSNTQLSNLPSFSPHPVPLVEEQQFSVASPDVAASFMMQGDTDTSNISPKANLVHGAPQQTKETTAVPPAIVSDPPSSSIPMPALRSSVIPVEPPPPVDSAVTQPDPVSQPGRYPYSSPTEAHSHTSQATSALDTHVTAKIGALNTHDGTRLLNPPIPSDGLPHLTRSVSPAPDNPTSFRHKDQHGINN